MVMTQDHLLVMQCDCFYSLAFNPNKHELYTGGSGMYQFILMMIIVIIIDSIMLYGIGN